MGRVRLVLYKESDGSIPLLDWLHSLTNRDRKAVLKCRAKLVLLSEFGNLLRRPAADYLRDGIYELRFESGGVNYRVLYFFSSTASALVVSHGLSKEARVPDREINRALERRRAFESNPEEHTCNETQHN